MNLYIVVAKEGMLVMVHLIPGLMAQGRGTFAASEPPWWYLTRTLAVSAYIALAVSVILGLLQSIARQGRQPLSWTIDELHRFCALLSGILIIGHMYTLYRDTFIGFSLPNLFFPVDQPYRPLATNLGVLSFYGIVALLLTSWLRRRIAYTTWRAIHYVSFAAFIGITLHGFLAGSDNTEAWLRAIYGAAAAAVLFLTAMRVFARSPGDQSATPLA